MKRNSQIVIRMTKSEIKNYVSICSDLNSLMSIRIRKFIELENKFHNKKQDLLQIIENIK